jgi:hypothetical protein
MPASSVASTRSCCAGLQGCLSRMGLGRSSCRGSCRRPLADDCVQGFLNRTPLHQLGSRSCRTAAAPPTRLAATDKAPSAFTSSAFMSKNKDVTVMLLARDTRYTVLYR